MDEDKKIYTCILAVDWSRDLFPDNKFGKCDKCGEMITFRPDAPEDMTKQCIDCTVTEVIKAEAEGEPVSYKVWNEKECKEIIKRFLEGEK